MERFEELSSAAQSALDRGDLERSLELYRDAEACARDSGDARLVDRARCNLFGVRLSLADEDPATPQAFAALREILLRNQDDTNCFLAAYNLSRAYELQREYRKGLFYGRIARDRSAELGRNDWLASSLNQIGNSLLAQSFFAEACDEYERALELLPDERTVRRALILTNLGYAWVVRGEVRRGLRRIVRCRRDLTALGAHRAALFAELDLCYAHTELGRYRHALRHGARALALAEENGDDQGRKNALMLLGEAANLVGDSETARGFFSRLQSGFFPNDAYIPDFLLAVSVRNVVNLRA